MAHNHSAHHVHVNMSHHHHHCMHKADMDHTMGHMMMMFFHAGYNETILFEPWTISSMEGLIISIIGIIIMATLYEGLKCYREYLFRKSYNTCQRRCAATSGSQNVVSNDNLELQLPTIFSWTHVLQTLLHFVQMTISFFLMLIFMTFNVWLCLAVVIGGAIGYFLFGWKKAVVIDVTEHCN